MSWDAPAATVADLAVGSARRHAGGTIEVRLGAGLPPAAPGQFVMVDVGDGVLAHPFTVFRTDPDGAFSLLLRPGGRPVQALLARARGAPVRAFGPLGRPFPPPAGGGRAYVVAESGRLAPTFGLARLIAAQGVPMAMVVGGERPEHFAALRALSALGVRVERRQGPGYPALARVLGRAARGDTMYVAGPEAALARADAALRRLAPAGVTGYLALEVAMACGVGACYGCPVPLANPASADHPYARACVEGPIFAAGVVALA